MVVYPQARVVEVSTGDATVEWALAGEQLRWALSQVRQPAGDVPPAVAYETETAL